MRKEALKASGHVATVVAIYLNAKQRDRKRMKSQRAMA